MADIINKFKKKLEQKGSKKFSIFFRFSRSATATTIKVASLRLLQDAVLQRLGLDGARPDRAHDEHLPTFRSGKGEISELALAI